MKEARTAEQLRAMVQVRLYAQPSVQRRLESGTPPSELPSVGLPVAHPRDAHGRDWDLREIRHCDGLETAVLAIVDGLRAAYSLAPGPQR